MAVQGIEKIDFFINIFFTMAISLHNQRKLLKLCLCVL